MGTCAVAAPSGSTPLRTPGTASSTSFTGQEPIAKRTAFLQASLDPSALFPNCGEKCSDAAKTRIRLPLDRSRGGGPQSEDATKSDPTATGGAAPLEAQVHRRRRDGQPRAERRGGD